VSRSSEGIRNVHSPFSFAFAGIAIENHRSRPIDFGNAMPKRFPKYVAEHQGEAGARQYRFVNQTRVAKSFINM
jgi:hypothetical protein